MDSEEFSYETKDGSLLTLRDLGHHKIEIAVTEMDTGICNQRLVLFRDERAVLAAWLQKIAA